MLCTIEDDYVRNRPRWVATLSDGVVVYGDDDRPGVEPPSAWVRLRTHCLEQGVGISRLHFQFRSNVQHLPPSEGYFFARTACGVDSGWTFDGVRIGYVVGETVFTVHYKTPELVVIDQDERPLDRASECIILGPSS